MNLLSLFKPEQPAPTNPELAEAEARIREANADADRAHQDQLRALELEQCRENLATKRDRKQAKQHRKHQRKAAVQRFFSELPARMITVPVILAAGSAWLGQFGYATAPEAAGGLGWDPIGGAALATALECLGLSLGALARKARQSGDSAMVERGLMWSIVGTAAAMNGVHSGDPVLAVMSIAGVAGWEAYERRRIRDSIASEGKLDRPERRPRFGIARWGRFLPWTFRAWSISVRDRLGPGQAQLALDRASIERDRNRGLYRFRPWKRRAISRRTRKFTEAHRAAEVDRANSILAKAEEVTGAAALLFGPEELRSTATAAENDGSDRGVTSIEHPPGKRRGLFRRSKKPTPINSGDSFGMSEQSLDPVSDSIESHGSNREDTSIECASIDGGSADRDSIEQQPQAGPIEPPTVVPSIGPRRERSEATGTARGKSIEDLIADTRGLIERGALPSAPSAEAIRTELQCAPKRARRVRDAFKTTTTDQTAA